MIALATSTACVFPPPLELDSPDAGDNAAPVILSVKNEAGVAYTSPGPVTLVVDSGSATVAVYDVDRNDDLYIQFFVDYDEPTNQYPRTPSCLAPSTPDGPADRLATCDTQQVCSNLDTTVEHFLEIDVYDRAPGNDPNGARPFRYLAPTSGGQMSTQAYRLLCQMVPP